MRSRLLTRRHAARGLGKTERNRRLTSLGLSRHDPDELQAEALAKARAGEPVSQRLRRLASLRPGTKFFLGSIGHARGGTWQTRGVVVGRGCHGGVDVSVRQHQDRRPQEVEWSSQILVRVDGESDGQ